MSGTITALVVQKRNKERVNVYLDGEFAFGLAMIEALKLKKGQPLTDQEIARLKALDEIEVAHEHALKYLSYRPRSTEEVRRNLRKSKRGFSETAIETTIERLERAGLLDDAAFVRFWVDNRERFKPRSRRALRYELRQRGVPNRVMDPILDEVDEVDAAYRAGEDMARRYARADEETFRKRLSSYLSRRGFAYGIVRETVDRIWSEMNAEPEASDVASSDATSPDADPEQYGEA
jgi:regulatory protein